MPKAAKVAQVSHPHLSNIGDLLRRLLSLRPLAPYKYRGSNSHTICSIPLLIPLFSLSPFPRKHIDHCLLACLPSARPLLLLSGWFLLDQVTPPPSIPSHERISLARALPVSFHLPERNFGRANGRLKSTQPSEPYIMSLPSDFLWGFATASYVFNLAVTSSHRVPSRPIPKALAVVTMHIRALSCRHPNLDN